MNEARAFLYAVSRTYTWNVLYAMLVLGPLPLETGAIARACRMDDEAAGECLTTLLGLEFIAHSGTEKKRTGWFITPTGRKFLLDVFALATSIPAERYLPQALPLLSDDCPNDSTVSTTGPSALALLQADTPAEAPLQAPLQADQPGRVDSVPVRPEVGRASVVVVLNRDSPEESSLNNNNTGPALPAKPEVSGAQPPSRSRHIRDVVQALARKGVEAPADDPLPLDLRACVRRLVDGVGMYQRRAEQVVARSPWGAAQILEQIDIWLAYRDSSFGANLVDSKFPGLVGVSLERGERCPRDTRPSLEAAEPETEAAEYAAPRPVAPLTADAALWNACLGRLRLELPGLTFERWVGPIRSIALNDDTLTLAAADPYALDWLKNRLEKTIVRIASELAGRPLAVKFRLERNGGTDAQTAHAD